MVKHALSLQGLALNFETGGAPDWVMLVPAGPKITGRDGRWWQVSNPQTVVDRFDPGKEPQIDIEHSSEIKAPQGEPAPAVGWIKGLEVRGGAIWGRVEWTPLGASLVSERAYRYLSPVFTFDFNTGEIGKLMSAGLTNEPNLELAALNRTQQETEMDRAVLEALGLNATATAADAVVAITTLRGERDTARNAAQTPDPARFVPVADHQLALNRIQTFEAEATARRDAAINTAVDGAIAAGKIAPSSRDFYIAACRAEGGLDRFTSHIASAPVVVPSSGLDGKSAADQSETQGGLSEPELAVCRMFGTDPTTFAAAKKKEA